MAIEIGSIFSNQSSIEKLMCQNNIPTAAQVSAVLPPIRPSQLKLLTLPMMMHSIENLSALR